MHLLAKHCQIFLPCLANLYKQTYFFGLITLLKFIVFIYLLFLQEISEQMAHNKGYLEFNKCYIIVLEF